MTYYFTIHSDSFNLLATGNKEGISMEYLDIKGQKTPTSYFTLNVMEIQVNIHQHSWKINLVQFHIYCGFFFILFVSFLCFISPHIVQ